MINISTSSQVCFSIEKSHYAQIKSSLPKSITVNPYFENKVLLVSASLNGGNVLDSFVDMIIEWNSQLGLTPSMSVNDKQQKDLIWEKLLQLVEAKSKISADKTEQSDAKRLKCKSTLFAERHDKLGFGRVENLRYDNIGSVCDVFEALCQGLIENLNDMFSVDLLERLGCTRIVATGSGVLRNKVLRTYLESIYGRKFSISFKTNNDSALGAALFCSKNI